MLIFFLLDCHQNEYHVGKGDTESHQKIFFSSTTNQNKSRLHINPPLLNFKGAFFLIRVAFFVSNDGNLYNFFWAFHSIFFFWAPVFICIFIPELHKTLSASLQKEMFFRYGRKVDEWLNKRSEILESLVPFLSLCSSRCYQC